MKSSNILAIVVFLLVAIGVGFAVFHFVDPAANPQTFDPDGPGRDVGTEGPVRGEARNGGNGRDSSRPPRDRINVFIRGTLANASGEAVSDATVTLSTPTRIMRRQAETEAEEETALLLYTLFELADYDDEPTVLRPFDEMLRSGEVVERKDGRQLAATRSGEDGTFEIALPLAYGGGPFVVRAEATGVGIGVAEGVRPGDEVELVLGDRQPFGGVVVDITDGIPVPGARVVIDTSEGPLDGRTDEAGRFEIEGIVPGRYRVRVYAEGRTPLVIERQALAPGDDLRLELPRGTSLAVTVVRPDETTSDDLPLEGAVVYLVNEADGTFHTARTNAIGEATFPRLLPGDYLVNATHEDFLDEGDELVRIGGNEVRKIHELYLIPAVQTPITVVDEDGRPLAGALFFTSSWDEEYDITRSTRVPGTTDDQGTFRYAFTFDGPRASLHVTKPGYAMVPIYPDDNESGDPMRVVLPPAYTVKGRVTNQDGAGLADVEIEIELIPDSEAYDDDLLLSIRTDADGRYEFPHLPAGELWIYAVADYDGDSSEDLRVGPENRVIEWDVTLDDTDFDEE